MKRLNRAFYSIGLITLVGGLLSAACGSDESSNSDATGGSTSATLGGSGTVGGTGATGVGGSGTATGGRTFGAGGSTTTAAGTAAPACQGRVQDGGDCDSATDTTCSVTGGGGPTGGMTLVCTCTADAWACEVTNTGVGGATGAGGATSFNTGTSAQCVQGVNTGSECTAADTSCSRLGGQNPRTCVCDQTALEWTCTSTTTGVGGAMGAGGATTAFTMPGG